jgi:hypothetical protein
MELLINERNKRKFEDYYSYRKIYDVYAREWADIDENSYISFTELHHIQVGKKIAMAIDVAYEVDSENFNCEYCEDLEYDDDTGDFDYSCCDYCSQEVTEYLIIDGLKWDKNGFCLLKEGLYDYTNSY